MTTSIKSGLGWVALAGSLALMWYGFAAANAAIFEQLALTPNATLIYVPAALRVIFPIVFGSAGVAGIIFGSFLVFPGEATDGPLDATIQAILSGLAPLIGLSIFKMLFSTRPDLADLKTVHLVSLALLCAGSNAMVIDLYLIISGHLMQPLAHILTIFIGDVLGTMIVLYIVAFGLTFFISRRRG